jgi:Leu/Phe-tRNA-protein transferase
MWKIDGGHKIFRHGQESYARAADIARECAAFRPDVEDEWVADEERSCYNCRMRRWTADAFECLADS